jgi:hypothetical protein
LELLWRLSYFYTGIVLTAVIFLYWNCSDGCGIIILELFWIPQLSEQFQYKNTTAVRTILKCNWKIVETEAKLKTLAWIYMTVHLVQAPGPKPPLFMESARPDIKCIIHLHTPEAIAVSINKLHWAQI